MAKLRSERL